MIYLDSCVLVGLCTQEVKSNAILKWYGSVKKSKLISSNWTFTEFASALGIKERTGQITSKESRNAWKLFETICGNDLELLPIDSKVFYSAGLLVLDSSFKLRVGDALHLAAAKFFKAKMLVTLDKVLEDNAARLKLRTLII